MRDEFESIYPGEEFGSPMVNKVHEQTGENLQLNRQVVDGISYAGRYFWYQRLGITKCNLHNWLLEAIDKG